jgi:hypothetical protein
MTWSTGPPEAVCSLMAASEAATVVAVSARKKVSRISAAAAPSVRSASCAADDLGACPPSSGTFKNWAYNGLRKGVRFFGVVGVF